MSVRTRYSLKVSVSSDPNTEDKDLGNLSYEVVSDSLGEGGARKFTLIGGATDIALAMGNVASASLVVIRTNAKNPLDTPGTITIKKNSTGGEATSIVPLTSTKEGHFLISTTGVTALYASNPGTVDMELTMAVCGD